MDVAHHHPTGNNEVTHLRNFATKSNPSSRSERVFKESDSRLEEPSEKGNRSNINQLFQKQIRRALERQEIQGLLLVGLESIYFRLRPLLVLNRDILLCSSRRSTKNSGVSHPFSTSSTLAAYFALNLKRINI